MGAAQAAAVEACKVTSAGDGATGATPVTAPATRCSATLGAPGHGARAHGQQLWCSDTKVGFMEYHALYINLKKGFDSSDHIQYHGSSCAPKDQPNRCDSQPDGGVFTD